jgi:proline racemase
VLLRITGQGWIYGVEKLRMEPDNPFAAVIALSDTWWPQVHVLG